MKTVIIPKSAKAHSYFYLRDNSNLYFDLTIYTTNNDNSYIRISVNDGHYHNYKIDIHNPYFEKCLVELLNSEFNLNITNRDRNSTETFTRVMLFCMNSLAENLGLKDFTQNYVTF